MQDTVLTILYAVAIPSTVILVLQTLLLLFGLGHGADADADGDVDVDFDHDGDFIDLDHDGIPDDLDSDVDADLSAGHLHGAHLHDSGLRLFTVRGMVAFFAVGGWGGIAALEMGAPGWLALTAALVLGVAALLLVAVFFKWAISLQSNGTIDLNNAVGCTGEVYLTVPAENAGKGKVNVIIQQRYSEIDAVTKCSRSLKYGERVRVVAMADSNTVIVEPEE